MPPSEIVERFARIRRDAPDRPLIHLPLARVSVTADGLWQTAADQQARLARQRFGPGDLVLYAAGNRPELPALWLACRALGIVLLPVDAGTTIHEIAALADRFGATGVILPDTSAPLPGATGEPYPGGLSLTKRSMPGGAPDRAGAAVLKLTSGSTGLPRATCTTEQQLIADVEHIIEAMDIRPGDCQICALPLSHAYGIGNLVLPLLVQGTAIVMREGFVPHQLPADAANHGARVLPGVPFMFDHFRDHLPAGSWPRGLDLVISAGARLDSSTLLPFHRAFGIKIHSFYGTSETGGIAYDDGPDLPEEGSVGRPMPGVTVTFRPEEGAPPDGGRVHVAGSAVASGYAGDRGQDGGFTDHGFLTGDYGRLSRRGHVVLTGRASAFINVAGRKVQPEEIEAVLREMKGVRDVRVLGVPDPSRGQLIVACVAARGAPQGLLQVRQYCATRLAPYKIPRGVIALDEIPLTERGKTDRRRLEAIVMEHLGKASGSGVL